MALAECKDAKHPLTLRVTVLYFIHTNRKRTMNLDQQLEARQARRMHAEDRFLARLEKREAAADKMMGELNGGKCYVYPVGGKYREGTRGELINFLVRNNYA